MKYIFIKGENSKYWTAGLVLVHSAVREEGSSKLKWDTFELDAVFNTELYDTVVGEKQILWLDHLWMLGGHLVESKPWSTTQWTLTYKRPNQII